MIQVPALVKKAFAIVCLGLAAASASYADGVVRAYVTNFGGDGISVVDPVERKLVADIKTGSKPHGTKWTGADKDTASRSRAARSGP